MKQSVSSKLTLRFRSQITEKEFADSSPEVVNLILQQELTYFLRVVSWAIKKNCLDLNTRLKLFNLSKLDSQQLEDCSLAILKTHRRSVYSYAKLVNNSVEFVEEKEKVLN